MVVVTFISIIPLTQDGSTPVNVASQEGHSDVVKILIGNGADINLAWKVIIMKVVSVLTYILLTL